LPTLGKKILRHQLEETLWDMNRVWLLPQTREAPHVGGIICSSGGTSSAIEVDSYDDTNEQAADTLAHLLARCDNGEKKWKSKR